MNYLCRGKGSWNGKWSQEGQCFARIYDQRKVPKEYWNKSFFYRWDDGWEACVTVTQMPASEARKIEKRSKGFCGYDWMIESIIQCGAIHTRAERKKMLIRKDGAELAIEAWNRRVGDSDD